MPKQTPSIPNEVVLAKLGDREALSDELWLISAQVGMLLGRSQDQLADDRKVGKPPAFKKDGGSIRYRLGTVRDHMFGLPEFNNTIQARLSAGNALLGVPFSNFLSWVDFSKPDDTWPCLVRHKLGPIDFWTSLTLGDQLDDEDYCEWLRLDDYLKLRRLAARSSWIRESQTSEDEASRPIVPAEIAVDGRMNKLWGAAILYQLVETENARKGGARFDYEIFVRLFNQANQPYLIPKTSVSNKNISDNHFEHLFTLFLEDCGDVISYAKNYPAAGFMLDVVNADGDMSNFYPDFIVKHSPKALCIVEANGSETRDVPLKMARLKRWCEGINRAQSAVTYSFVFVDQASFDKNRPPNFKALVDRFNKYQ